MSEVETTLGRVQGQTRGDQHVFRGIPFAKPPVGPLRFLPPQALDPWSDTRPALEFGPSAMQLASPIAGMGADGPQSEDCLYLNVYTPAPDGARRPVLFWIHGGAFTMGSGSSELYDGKRFVERGDVVVVTINYRLGVFGYLSFTEHGGDAWGATCNAGQLDQIAALEWVRDNIATFGGDPDNVTIFGESAGSFAVSTLMAMPRARGLFHRAVGQSGAATTLRTAKAQGDITAAILRALEIDPSESRKLQDVPAQALLDQQIRASGETLAGYFPVVDGKTVPTDPTEAIAAGDAADVPLILGSNRDEMNLFVAPTLRDIDKPMSDERVCAEIAKRLPEGAHKQAPAVLEAYRASRKAQGLPCSNRALLTAMQGDATFRIPATRYADAHQARQPATYMYLFKHESPAMRGALRACHALEIPFVFGTLDAPFQDRFAGKGPVVEKLSETMMDAWLAFARTGNPSTDRLPWAPYEPNRRPTMIFDAASELQEQPLEQERAAWDGVL